MSTIDDTPSCGQENDHRRATPSRAQANDKFNRTYAVEIQFDTSIDFAEQDRLACVVLEKLVEEWWEMAQLDTAQGNNPVKVLAYPIERPR
jgi:hypothetical protein